MTVTDRHGRGHTRASEEAALWLFLVLVALLVAGTELGVRVGGALSNVRQPIPANPFQLVFNVLDGSTRWPAAGTPLVAAAAVAVVVLAVAVLARRGRGRADRRADRAAALMGTGRALEPITRRGAQATAQRLGVAEPGLRIARAVAGGRDLYANWEDVCLDIAGPRSGKTTSRAISSLLDAPGAAFATSNKRDLVDATRGPRAQRGPVWVFDPQRIVREPLGWWWNPLDFITVDLAGAEARARELADIFSLAGRDVDARTDAYFDPAAKTLLAGLLLAAAVAERPLGDVFAWLTQPLEHEPVHVLSAHNYAAPAQAVRAVINAPDKQRGGVYGTALEMCAWMVDRNAMQWVTPHPWRPRLKLDELVAGSGTLYSISREGQGSCAALVTAMTAAVCDAAERRAAARPNGRLDVPMVFVLDEAANVVRWRQLPNLYSHYGSRGMLVYTLLQAWSQGVEVWGRAGMAKLWSAATIKVVGSGVGETDFLEQLSKLIGTYNRATTSTNVGPSGPGRGAGRSSTFSTTPTAILEVADLAALPRFRVVLLASGSPPVLAQPVPWWERRDADEIRASQATASAA